MAVSTKDWIAQFKQSEKLLKPLLSEPITQEKVEEFYKKHIKDISVDSLKWSRVKTRKVYTSDTTRAKTKVILFKSYDTVVAFILPEHKKWVDIGRFGKTSAKQMTVYYQEEYKDYERIRLDFGTVFGEGKRSGPSGTEIAKRKEA